MIARCLVHDSGHCCCIGCVLTCSSSLSGRISHNERNNAILPRAEEPPLLEPHHLPQCVKHEPGCKVSKVDTILELFDPVSWFVNTAVKVKERAEKYVSVFLYQVREAFRSALVDLCPLTCELSKRSIGNTVKVRYFQLSGLWRKSWLT